MATLEEMIKTESCFYSVRSDDSMLLVLKVRESYTHRSWVLIRTDTKKQARSDEWPLSKIGNKEMALFPALSTEELTQSAHEGDFLEWLPGCAAPAQSESEILLDKRERLLEKRIGEVSTALSEQKQSIEARIEDFLSELNTQQEGMKSETEALLHKQEGILEKQKAEALAAIGEQGREVNTRIENFLSELPGMASEQIATAEDLLQEAQKEAERIKGEVKYFQMTLDEKRKESLAAFEQRSDQASEAIGRAQHAFNEQWEEAATALTQQVQTAETRISHLQSSLEVKEQALQSLVTTQTKDIEERVQALRRELAEQQPLSEERHRQDISRKTFWLAVWFVASGIIFFAVTGLSALLPVANTLLIEIFGCVAAILSLLLGGTTFLVRRKGV